MAELYLMPAERLGAVVYWPGIARVAVADLDDDEEPAS
jgi:hypothetical protein